MYKVLAVIPTLGNDIGRLKSCILSINTFCHFYDMKIIVINNGDKDCNSVLSKNIEVVSPGINLGWVGSLEFVRRNYKFEYLWTIQDDMILLNDNLKIFLEEFKQDKRLAIVSPVIVKNGFIPAKSRGGVFTDKSKLKWEHFPVHDLALNELKEDYDFLYVTLSGALIKNKAIEDTLGFDLDLYPLLFVDVDFCYKLLKKNWKIKLSKKAIIEHKGQGSTPSFLGKVIYRTNEEIFKQKTLSKFKQSKNDLRLDADMIWSIAKKSSNLIFELSIQANNDINVIENQKNNLLNQFDELKIQNERMQNELINIYNSKAWRFSILLRKILSLFK